LFFKQTKVMKKEKGGRTVGAGMHPAGNDKSSITSGRRSRIHALRSAAGTCLSHAGRSHRDEMSHATGLAGDRRVQARQNPACVGRRVCGNHEQWKGRRIAA
jgi:hypothetical protein